MPRELPHLSRLPERMAFAAVDAWARRHSPTVSDFLRSREGGQVRRYETALPRCANDKYTWRKIFDHDPRHVMLSDKLACNTWVAAQGLELRIPRVLWQGDDAREIPAALLERPVIAKANHGSDMNIRFLHGRPDRSGWRQRANGFLRREHGRWAGQWGYLGIERRLFVEAMIGAGGPHLVDLKFFTYGRRVERMKLIADRFGAKQASHFEPAGGGRWRPFEALDPGDPRPYALPLPDLLPRAVAIASELGASFDHVRVDLITDGKELWFNEMTLCNLGGHLTHTGTVPERATSRAWDIRRSWFLTTPQTGWRAVYAAMLRRALDRAARDAPALPPA